MCSDAAGPCRLVEDTGFMVCINCGCVKSRALETVNRSFGTITSRLRPAYTRSGRFVKKVLGALNRRVSCFKNKLLLEHLREKKVSTPEAVLEGIRTWITGSDARKPYVNASFYGAELGLGDVTMSARDITFICKIFDEIFFAHKRLQFTGPNFPFSELLHLIVESFEFDACTVYVTRYAKRLRCPIRTERYAKMFRKCLRYIVDARKIDCAHIKCLKTSSVSGKTSHISQSPPSQHTLHMSNVCAKSAPSSGKERCSNTSTLSSPP